MRYITEESLDDIALGAAILGTGGGGDPRLGMLLARNAIRQHGPVELVDLDEVSDEAVIGPVCMMGAPTVANEKLPSLHAMATVVGAVSKPFGSPATHTMAVEIGGIAALLPIAAAAELGIPLVDADMMGRAFPELQMVIPALAGMSACPMSMADEWGNTVLLDCQDNLHAERLARTICVEMGASALIALYPLKGAQARSATVPGTLSLAERLGSSVREARAAHGDPVQSVVDLLGGYQLFSGKVIDLVRRTEGGFARMEAALEGIGADADTSLSISSQNEHLVARTGPAVLATTPDLIMLLDSRTGEPVTTEALRYGARVTVVAAPCDPRFRSADGLSAVGPRAFGYDLDYLPVEFLAAHRPRVGSPS